MTHPHVADFAELYALGALTDNERAAIEAHLRECPSCARLVASAERDVALVASMEERRGAPSDLGIRIDAILKTDTIPVLARSNRSSWPLPAVLAAALIVGFLPSAYLWSQNRAMHVAMATQTAAMERLASTAHRTVRFHSAPVGLPAQVVYGPDGSWYLVIVRGASRALAVAWMHDGERTMLGNVEPHGDLAMLYLPQSHRMDRLALMDGDRIVAEATLSWQRNAPNRPAGRSS